MFPSTTNAGSRTAALRKSVLDAVDLAVAFATLESYALPGSSRAEQFAPAQAGADRSARIVPDASDATGSGPLTALDPHAGRGALSWLQAPSERSWLDLPRPATLDGVPTTTTTVRSSASRSARTAGAARNRRPGQVRAPQFCTTPLDALARPEPPRHRRGERRAAG